MIKVIGTIVFLLFASGVFCWISWIVKPRWYEWMTTANVQAVNFLPENSIEVAVLGSSAGIRSFSPLELWKEYGITAYNISTEQQPLMGAYYILKDFLKRQNPKVVFIEAWELIGSSDEEFYRKSFDNLKLSLDKLEVAKEQGKKENASSPLSYICTILQYHTNWKNLDKWQMSGFDASEFPAYHQGFVMNPYSTPVDFAGWTDTGQDVARYNPEGLKYLTMLVDLCKKNDIAVVLYKCPFNDNVGAHNAIKNFAESMGVPFIDFHMQDIIAESGFDYLTGISDGQHNTTSGAEQITRYLGKYITETDDYGLTDHRGDPAYSYMEELLVDYEREKYNEKYICETNMQNYLDLLLNSPYGGYTAIFSVKDEAATGMNDALRSKFAELGFRTDFSERAIHHSFLGVWQDGHVVYEKISEGTHSPETDALQYKGTLSDGKKYFIKSAGYFCGNISEIILDGVQYSKNERGFNMVLYDTQTSRVIDSITWDTCQDAGITFKR